MASVIEEGLCSTGGMILTGQTEVLGVKHELTPPFPSHLNWTDIGSHPVPRDDRKAIHLLIYIHILALLMEAHCVICEVPTECILCRMFYPSQKVCGNAPGPPTAAHLPSPGAFLRHAPGTFPALSPGPFPALLPRPFTSTPSCPCPLPPCGSRVTSQFCYDLILSPKRDSTPRLTDCHS
jgi:hypothetical protein